MRRWPVIGVALAVVWVFVTGPESASGLLGAALAGLVVGEVMAYAFRRFYRPTIDPRSPLRTAVPVVIYLITFLWEVITANVDVAYRVVHPSMPIEPAVFEVPLRVETDAAITTIANSITLTPGTLTMDHDPDRNVLYVHTIAWTDRESLLAPIRRWEDLALVIFAEDRAPGDPVPGGDHGG
ncbi:MAG: Na+/H+ antiporter subunit E [Halococcoides sp.]